VAVSRRNLALFAGGAAVLALMAWGVYSFVSKIDDKPKKAPKISLMPSTPPPPPPPPKEEKKPEPPKDLNKPPPMEQPKMAPPAPSADLKMDGPAGDGPSAFSAGKISSEDLSNVGKGPGGPGGSGGSVNAYNYYANLIKTELQRQLNRNKDLREIPYKAEVQVWVGRDGSVSRFELVNGTGDAELDGFLKKALSGSVAFSAGPPDKMPQPIRLRISTGR